MRLGFFVDGPISMDKSGKIYGVALNDKVFGRYTAFADEIELCARKQNIRSGSQLSEIASPNISFTPCVDMSKPTSFLHKEEARKTIHDVMSRCDGAIIRLPSRISQIAVEECRKQNKPYLVEMVGCPFDALWNHSFQGKVVAIPFALETRKATKNAHAVLYVTNEFLQRRYPTDGLQIGCSDVELLEFDESVLAKRLEKIRNKKDNKIVIGTTAAVNVRYKGQQYVIKALARLKKKGMTNFEYQLAGNGDQSYLKNLAKELDVEDQVKLLGGIPHAQVFDWLDSLDMYVQPSKQEGLPRALVEAMSRGIPAIGSMTGGIPELIAKELIFSNSRNNDKEIADLLVSFDKPKMEKYAQQNFEKAREYRKEVLEERRLKFYRDYFLENVKSH